MTDNASEIDVTARSTIGKTTASNQISSRAKKLGQLVEKGLSGLGENQIKGFLNNALLEIEGSLADFEKDYDAEIKRFENLLKSRKSTVTKALAAGLVKVQYGKGQDFYAVDYAQMYNAFFEKVLKIVKATKPQGSNAILGEIKEHIQEMIGNDALTDEDKALMNRLVQEMQALQKERAKIKVIEVGKPPEQKVTVEVKQEVTPVTQEQVVAAVKEKQAAGIPIAESTSLHSATIKKLEADVARLQKEMEDADKKAAALFDAMDAGDTTVSQSVADAAEEDYQKKMFLWKKAQQDLENEKVALKREGLGGKQQLTAEEVAEFRKKQKAATGETGEATAAPRSKPDKRPSKQRVSGGASRVPTESEADYVKSARERIKVLDDAYDQFIGMQSMWMSGIEQSITDMLDGVRLASQEMVYVITAEIQKNIGGKLKTIGKQIEESFGAKSTSGVSSIAGKLDTINTTLLEIKNGLIRQKYMQDVKSVPKSIEDEAPQKAIAEIIGNALNQELAPLLGEVLGETSEYNWQKWLTLEGDVRKPFIDKFIGLNKGGIVPGTGTSDSVPALLTPGEWVINPRRLAGGTFDFAYEADAVLKSASMARKYKNEYAYLSSLPSDRSIALVKDLLLQPMDKVIAYDTSSNIAGAIGSFNRPTLTDSVLPIRGADRGSGWNMYVGELAALERGKGLGPTLIGMALAKALKGPVGDLLTHIELKAIPFKDTVASYLKMGFIPVGEQNPLEPLIPMAANIKDFLASPKVSPDVRLALPKKGVMSREHPALKAFSLTAFPYEVIDPVTAAGTIVPAGTRTPSIFRYLAGGTITDIAAYIRHAIFGAPGFNQELAPLLGEVLGETSEYNWQKWLTLEGDVRKPFIDKFIGLNKGGIVPGTGTSDSVPALLTPGEWVINPRKLAGGTLKLADLDFLTDPGILDEEESRVEYLRLVNEGYEDLGNVIKSAHFDNILNSKILKVVDHPFDYADKMFVPDISEFEKWSSALYDNFSTMQTPGWGIGGGFTKSVGRALERIKNLIPYGNFESDELFKPSRITLDFLRKGGFGVLPQDKYSHVYDEISIFDKHIEDTSEQTVAALNGMTLIRGLDIAAAGGKRLSKSGGIIPPDKAYQFWSLIPGVSQEFSSRLLRMKVDQNLLDRIAYISPHEVEFITARDLGVVFGKTDKDDAISWVRGYPKPETILSSKAELVTSKEYEILTGSVTDSWKKAFRDRYDEIIYNLGQSEIITSVFPKMFAAGGPLMPGQTAVVGEEGPEMLVPAGRGFHVLNNKIFRAIGGMRFLKKGTVKADQEPDLDWQGMKWSPDYVTDMSEGLAFVTGTALKEAIRTEVGPEFRTAAGGFTKSLNASLVDIVTGRSINAPETPIDPVKQMKLNTGKLGMQFGRLVSSTRYAVTGALIFAHVLRILTATSQVYQKSMGAVGRGWGYMLDMIIRPLLPAFLLITRGFIWIGNFFRGNTIAATAVAFGLVGVAIGAAVYSIWKMKKDIEAASAAFEKLTAALNGTPYTPPEQGPGILSRIWGGAKSAGASVRDWLHTPITGKRKKAALGMRIPGYGGGDSVPVLTEPGELIVPKEVVRRFEHRAEGGVAGAGGDFGSWIGGIIGGAGDIFKGGITTIAQGVGSFLSSDIGKSIVGGLGVASKMIGAVMAPIAGVGIAIGAIKGGMHGLGRIFVKGQQAQIETSIAVGKAQRNLLSMISLEGMGLLVIAGLSLAVLNSILHALPVATLPGPAGKGVGDIFKDLFGSLWEFIKEKARGLFDWLKEKAAGIWEFIREKAAGIWEFIKEKALGIWDAIKERALGIWEAIKERLGGIWESIKERALGIWEFIKEKAGGIWKSIKEKASGVWDFAKTKLGEVIEVLKGLLPKGVDVAKNLGQKVVDTVLGKEVFDEITGESMGRKGGVAGVLKDVAAVGDRFLGKGGTAALTGATGLGLFTGTADYIRTGDVGSAATTGAMTTAGAFAFAKLLTMFPKLGPVGGVAGYFARDTMIKDGATIGKAIAGPIGEDVGGVVGSLVNDIAAGAATGSTAGPVGTAAGAILGPIVLGFKDLFAMKEEADKLASGLNLTPEQANAGGHLTNQYGFLGSVAATAYNTGVDLQGAPAVVGAAVTGGIDTATRAISDALTKAGDVLSAVVATVTGVVDAVIATVTAWQESAAAAGDTVREAILGAFASLGEYLAGLPSAIMEIIDRYLSGLPGIGGLFNSAKGALNIPSMASGGDILSDGVVNVHSGEAIIPARVNTNSNVRTDTTKTTITNHNTFVVQREDDRILFEKFKQMMVADSRRLVI